MKTTSLYLLGGSLICAAGLTAGVNMSLQPSDVHSHKLTQSTEKSEYRIGQRVNGSLTKLSLMAQKNKIAKGENQGPNYVAQAVDVPWSVNFAETGFGDFTVIDANQDEITWEHSNGQAQANYSPKDPMDDWLITPPLKMNGGEAYTITVIAAANSNSYDERMEILYGEENTVQGMVNVAKESFDIVGTDFKEYTGTVVPNRTGQIFIGLHGISDPDRYKILVSEIKVEAGAEGEMPAGVSDLTLSRGGDYDLTATISFVAPTKSMSGALLNSLDRIEVKRNGELIETIESPAPGSEQQLTDVVPMGGLYEYTVTAWNEAGEGFPMKALFKIGAPAPDAPEMVRLEEIQDGYMKLSWTPVTHDMEGNEIPEGMVRYLVVDTEMTPIAEELTQTEIYFSVNTQDQIFVECLVAAYTMVGGVGDARMSNVCAVGPAYDGSSFSESFTNGNLDTIMGVGYEFGYVDYVGWDIATDSTFESETGTVSASDGDNGFVYMQSEFVDSGASLFTGKMTLPTEGVGVKFDIFNQSQETVPDGNLVEVLVTENGDDWEVVDSFTVNQMCGLNKGWNEVTVGLQEYAGKTIQLRWQVTVKDYGLYLMDNIRIVGLYPQDLSIRSFNVPMNVNPNEEMTAEVEVLHLGQSDTQGYTVDLYANDIAIATKYQGLLRKGTKEIVKVPYILTPAMNENTVLTAKLRLEGDGDLTNNESDPVNVHIELPKTPYVTDLNGQVDDKGNVSLSWSEPYISGYVPGDYESFESGVDFAHEFEGWIFIDRDQKPIGGLTPSTIPGVVPSETLASFIVINQNEPSFSQNLRAHTGEKFLLSLFNYYGDQNDDWVITPELNGAAQVVSFWARSLEGYYAESMEIYYSFGSTDPSDFVKIIGVETVPGEWTEYQIPIPNGAKRFAVRNVSKDKMALLLDDFFFADAASPSGVSLTGYNVYCDYKKVGETGKDTRTFSHLGTNGSRIYNVTAVYEGNGESRGSNNVILEVTGGVDGVAAVSADGAGILKLGDVLCITGHAGESLHIYNVDGTEVESVSVLPSEYRTELLPGLYIIKAGKSVRKLKF